MMHSVFFLIVVGLCVCVWANEGWSSDCDTNSIGNEACDIECYSETNNWDGGDCDVFCNAGCGEDVWDHFIGDGDCDPWCMTEACEYDGGDCDLSDCGSWNCVEDELENRDCDLECASAECLWDNGYCLYLNCAPECDPITVGDEDCNWDCNNAGCDYDLLACVESCSLGCWEDEIGDARCDEDCYNDNCEWDDGDCNYSLQGYCNFECLNTQVGDGVCDNDCYNDLCDWDGTDCDDTYCGPYKCLKSWVGDERCDWLCNIEECNYDEGDCDFTYVAVDASFTDDTCTGDVISVYGYYYAPDVIIPMDLQCRELNHGHYWITVAEFESKLDSWFEKEPAWTAQWPNANCEGLPWDITYFTNADCILINNNLWGYYEWNEKGVMVPWLCTDSACEHCTVQPEGEGIESYYYGCWADYPYHSFKSFSGTIYNTSSSSSSSSTSSSASHSNSVLDASDSGESIVDTSSEATTRTSSVADGSESESTQRVSGSGDSESISGSPSQFSTVGTLLTDLVLVVVLFAV